MSAVPRSTTAVTLAHDSRLSGSRTVGWWGMLLLILTEATVFAALISSYFYLRSNSPTWPLGDIERPELTLVSINTVILLVSSIPMQFGMHSIRRGNRRGFQIALIIAWLLGAIFLVLQGVEYSRTPFTPQTNVYGSIFFTTTAIHGVHVLIGLGLALIVLIRSWFGHFDESHYQAVENTAIYWHFVDAVWIVVFSSLYLSVYLM
jgi:heme/copper-type cytochrome/quinol oxidase subunit 3